MPQKPPEVKKTRKVGKQKPKRQDLILQSKEPTAKELKKFGFSPDEALDLLIERKKLHSM